MERDPQQQPQAAGAGTQRSGPQPMPRCPQCGWSDVRLSRTKKPLDVALGVFSVAPFRCRSCGARFYRAHKRRDTEA